jgi:hypothetical protein
LRRVRMFGRGRRPPDTGLDLGRRPFCERGGAQNPRYPTRKTRQVRSPRWHATVPRIRAVDLWTSPTSGAIFIESRSKGPISQVSCARSLLRRCVESLREDSVTVLRLSLSPAAAIASLAMTPPQVTPSAPLEHAAANDGNPLMPEDSIPPDPRSTEVASCPGY